jgi:hypothetical protein
MFMQGTDVIKFFYLEKEHIPVEWTVHHEAQALLMAESQGRDISELETMVFLVAPECTLSMCYQGWLTGLDRETSKKVVPLCVVCASTFDRDFGEGSTARFNRSMREIGRPCQFQRMQFDKRK